MVMMSFPVFATRTRDTRCFSMPFILRAPVHYMLGHAQKLSSIFQVGSWALIFIFWVSHIIFGFKERRVRDRGER